MVVEKSEKKQRFFQYKKEKYVIFLETEFRYSYQKDGKNLTISRR